MSSIHSRIQAFEDAASKTSSPPSARPSTKVPSRPLDAGDSKVPSRDILLRGNTTRTPVLAPRKKPSGHSDEKDVTSPKTKPRVPAKPDWARESYSNELTKTRDRGRSKEEPIPRSPKPKPSASLESLNHPAVNTREPEKVSHPPKPKTLPKGAPEQVWRKDASSQRGSRNVGRIILPELESKRIAPVRMASTMGKLEKSSVSPDRNSKDREKYLKQSRSSKVYRDVGDMIPDDNEKFEEDNDESVTRSSANITFGTAVSKTKVENLRVSSLEVTHQENEAGVLIPPKDDVIREIVYLQNYHDKFLDFLMVRFVSMMLRKHASNQALEAKLNKMFEPIVVFKAFQGICVQILLDLTFSRPDTLNKLCSGLTVFTSKQLKQAYLDYVNVYDTLVTLAEAEIAASLDTMVVKPSDFSRPLFHFIDVFTMVELLLIEKALVEHPNLTQEEAISQDVGPISVIYKSLKALITHKNFEQFMQRLCRERLQDIQDKITSTGSNFEIPLIEDSHRRLIWTGQFMRPSSAFFSRNQIKKYRFSLFSDLLVWTNFRDTLFKGILTISKEIQLKHDAENPLALLITVFIPKEAVNQTLEFRFDRASAKNVMTYLLKSCAMFVPSTANSSIEIKPPTRIQSFISGFLGIRTTRSNPDVVSKPFNLKHEYHVNENLEWKLDEGKLEDQFEVLEQIGKGGFAVVYKVFHKHLRQIFAIKMIQVEDTKKLAVVARELDILKKLRNEFIVAYYGCAGPDSNSRLWIMMDYCRGGSLYDLIKATGVLDEQQISFVMFCTLKALYYLHSQGIIHRDIKARNILLCDAGTTKLADFGVSAHIADLKPDEKTRTGINAFVGTPYWMAPEVIVKDKQSIGYKSDIWALGITAIELALGEPPLSEMNPIQACTVIAVAEPPRLPERFSAHFRDFVSRCLMRNVEERSDIVELLVHPFLHLGKGATECLLDKMSSLLADKSASLVKSRAGVSNNKETRAGAAENFDDDESADITIPDDAVDYDTRATSEKRHSSGTMEVVSDEDEDAPKKTHRSYGGGSGPQRSRVSVLTVGNDVTFDTMVETVANMEVDPKQVKNDYTIGDDVTFDHDPDFDDEE